MKLEVGKKYVDRSGDVWEIVHKVKTSYVGDCSVGTTVGFFDYEGYYKSDDDETCDLVKEYHEPRPVKEVMGDLMVYISDLWEEIERDAEHTKSRSWEFDCSPCLRKKKALLQEAEEVMKGLKGE